MTASRANLYALFALMKFFSSINAFKIVSSDGLFSNRMMAFFLSILNATITLIVSRALSISCTITRDWLFEDISSLTIYQNGGQIRYNLGNIGITIDELKNNKSTILLNDIENVGVVYQKLKNLKGGDKNDM